MGSKQNQRISRRSNIAFHRFFGSRAFIALIGVALQFSPVSNATASSRLSADAPDKLLEAARPLANRYFTTEHWEAVRNLTAAARAVVILPRGGEAGLLIGGEWGRGLMFVRHGDSWSNPVFVKLGSLQFGFLIGGQSVGLIGALLTKRALDRAIDGKALASGSGDLTLGEGVSARVAGGTTGGIEFLSVSSDKGLYFGGSIERLRIHIDTQMNRIAYGRNFNLQAIINSTNRNYPPARPLLDILHKAAHQAFWGQ